MVQLLPTLKHVINVNSRKKKFHKITVAAGAKKQIESTGDLVQAP